MTKTNPILISTPYLATVRASFIASDSEVRITKLECYHPTDHNDFAFTLTVAMGEPELGEKFEIVLRKAKVA